MNEQEARQRMQQNDASFATERERLQALADAESREHTPPGQKPRGASELVRVGPSLTEKLLAEIPPAFNHAPPSNDPKVKTLEDLEEERRRTKLEKLLACMPPKPRALVLAGHFDGLLDPATRDATLQSLEAESPAVVLAVEWFFANQHRILILRGGVGTRKTTAACVVLWLSVMLSGASRVSFMRPRQFISSMLHSYQPDFVPVGRDFHVIDDLGEENRLDFHEALATWLDESDTRGVLTTNLPGTPFAERYQGRVFDRLRECAAWVPVKGESTRTGGGGFKDFEGVQQRLELPRRSQ